MSSRHNSGATSPHPSLCVTEKLGSPLANSQTVLLRCLAFQTSTARARPKEWGPEAIQKCYSPSSYSLSNLCSTFISRRGADFRRSMGYHTGAHTSPPASSGTQAANSTPQRAEWGPPPSLDGSGVMGTWGRVHSNTHPSIHSNYSLSLERPLILFSPSYGSPQILRVQVPPRLAPHTVGQTCGTQSS